MLSLHAFINLQFIDPWIEAHDPTNAINVDFGYFPKTRHYVDIIRVLSSLWRVQKLFLKNVDLLFVSHRRDIQTLGCCQSVKQHKRENTYTEIGGYSLSPHVGGFFRVTHHLHGVHLNTKTHSEHATLTYSPGQEHRCKCSRFKWDAVHLQPGVLCGLCKD